MLMVSVNGAKPVPASSVVIYDDDIPAAVSLDVDGSVMYADSARDKDFLQVLSQAGIPTHKMHQYAGVLRGNIPETM